MLTILQLEGCCCAGVWLVLLIEQKHKLLVGGLYIICCYLDLQIENYVVSSGHAVNMVICLVEYWF